MTNDGPAVTLRYRSYAKINLFLRVLRRRADGFHDIETLFQSVSLYDEMAFSPDVGIVLECDSAQTGPPEKNLAYRAAALAQKHFAVAEGVRIALKKRIPVAAGLAGGSGNAAATLHAVSALWKRPADGDELDRMGLTLGSDVPFCLHGGAAAATGQGERLTALPIGTEAWFVALHPQIAVSTPWVYSHPDLPREDTPGDGAFSGAFQSALDAWRIGDWTNTLYNAMEGPVFAAHPQLAAWKADLVARGCVAAIMSGSGPTLVGVCETEGDAARVASTFEGVVPVSVLQPTPFGIEAV